METDSGNPLMPSQAAFITSRIRVTRAKNIADDAALPVLALTIIRVVAGRDGVGFDACAGNHSMPLCCNSTAAALLTSLLASASNFAEDLKLLVYALTFVLRVVLRTGDDLDDSKK